ncbi:transcriptional regulator [Micromonospora zhanjiangensis]
MAQLIRDRTEALRRMDDHLGGGDLYDLVYRELRATLDLVREATYTEKTGRHLLAALGELCQLTGWVASDAGLTEHAERFYLGGAAAAHAAGDEPLAANLLSSLAYQVANIGDPREAVVLASTAYQGARSQGTARVRAMLLDRLAWANARLGDSRETARALEAVEDAAIDEPSAEDPQWVYWLDRAEAEVMAGRCQVELQKPKKAIQLLGGVVPGYDDDHGREKALYLSWLAEAHLQDGDPEQAASVALLALKLSTGVASARGNARMKHLDNLLAPHRANLVVRTFNEKITTLCTEAS